MSTDPRDHPVTVPAAFAAAITPDPTRPLLTWYDDATGDRAELSGATLGNWVAKSANLLVDGCGLGPGDAAVVAAPPHWQTAAILLGCWAAGLRVNADPDSGADPDVVLATVDRATAHAGGPVEVYGLALAPLAAPMREAPAGVTDFVTEVRGYADEFHPAVPVSPEDPATGANHPGVSHAALCRDADARGGALGISPGDRVLIDIGAHPDPRDWLLAPLVRGATTVLCAHPDPEALPRRREAERVTVAVPGSA